MLTLEDLCEGTRLEGLAGHATITVVAIERFGELLQRVQATVEPAEAKQLGFDTVEG